MRNTVLSGEQLLKSRFLGNLREAPIFEGGAAFLSRRSDAVSNKKASDCERRSLVKQDAHY